MINVLYGSMSTSYDNAFTVVTHSDEEAELIRRSYDVKEMSKINNTYIINIVHNYKTVRRFGKGEPNNKYSNIAIASAITSKARTKMYKGLVEIAKNGGVIHYMDTDSYFASFKKIKALEWGKLFDQIFILMLFSSVISFMVLL